MMADDQRDARVLLLLCSGHTISTAGAPAPLSVAEWHRLATSLHRAGLSRPGDLLDIDEAFWTRSGLADEDRSRLQRLLEGGAALDAETERLAGLGVQAVTSADTCYPRRLRERLRGAAPPVLFGAGEWSLLAREALAIVGSRDVDDAGADFAREVARRCARDGLTVVTGGARGVDRIALEAALEAGGTCVGVVAGDLERLLRAAGIRRWLKEGTLLLLSCIHPRVRFSVANAMARNKVIYALAEWGLVVASAHGQGGTWTGAREALRRGWVPLFVRDGAAVPDGNRELLRPAALPFPSLDALGDEALPLWLAGRASGTRAAAEHEPAEHPEAVDLFPLVWPRVAAFLQTPRRLDEVADAFHLLPAQIRAWLQRAEAEGKVTAGGEKDCLYRAAGL